ncbi:MAG: ABC transporter substrate-binding protein [Pseudomonadota bacterium]
MLNSNTNDNVLTFVETNRNSPPSFNPKDSDIISNMLYMESLVGTLIRFQSSGRYEPYLAQKWEVSSDQMKWDFFLTRDLRCADGIEITADQYIRSLKQLFKLYLKKSRIPVFEKLRGWSDFVNGDDFSLGLEVVDKLHLRFIFDKRPEGLLEYLSMPFYGFYSPNNFANSDWKHNAEIISSGACKLTFVDKNRVVLTKRKDWFSVKEDTPSIIVFESVDYKSALDKYSNSKHVIIAEYNDLIDNIPYNFIRVHNTPTHLLSLVLSPYIKNVFDNPKNRMLFKNKIRKGQNKIAFNSKNSMLSKSFYPLHSQIEQTDLFKDERIIPRSNAKLKIIFISTILESERNYIEQLIGKVLDDENIPYEFITVDQSKPKWLDLLHSNKEYDLRVCKVDIGGNIENWVIKMMFCSKLGVSFPDPTDRMCKLVSEQEQKGLYSVDNQYIKDFNKIIEADSVVIPLYHTGLTWLFTKDINIQKYSPTMNFPMFELLALE